MSSCVLFTHYITQKLLMTHVQKPRQRGNLNLPSYIYLHRLVLAWPWLLALRFLADVTCFNCFWLNSFIINLMNTNLSVLAQLPLRTVCMHSTHHIMSHTRLFYCSPPHFMVWSPNVHNRVRQPKMVQKWIFICSCNQTIPTINAKPSMFCLGSLSCIDWLQTPNL